ncbi:MAG: hypothetical protein ABI999_15205 [Acidobacteriota bacterium]
MAKLLATVAALTLLSFGIYAQTVVKTSSSAVAAPAFFPLSELREGMHGVAKTVFRGSEPEEFNVEILGILPGGVGPKQDLIIGKISGGSADRTAVFAGMSGSPVYIDGRLVGALSYSFPFSKEAICGITPIEQMIAIFEQKQPAKTQSAETRSFSFTEVASNNWQTEAPAASRHTASAVSDPRLAAVSGQAFQPIATPVTFTGFSQATLDKFAPQLLQAGLMPVSAAGGSSAMSPMKTPDDQTLLGGASVSMQLSRGDYSLAASGTVTLRDGEKVYAFGHPFLALGTSDLPMSESHVITVVPNLNNSFKLAVPDSMVGSMTQDRATGVFGKLGRSPNMIPVTLNIQTSRGQTQTLNFEIAKDDFLTPLLLNITAYNSIVANERGLGDLTIELDGNIEVKGHDPIKLQRRFAGPQAAQFASASVALPAALLFRGSFDKMDFGKIVLNLRSIDGSKTAVLDRIAVDKLQAKAGETVEVQAFVRAESGKTFVQKIPVTIPAGISPGPLSIVIGDGGLIQQNAPVQQFIPKDLTEMISTLNNFKVSDRLYAQVVRNVNGAVIGVSELPNLPPSVLATMNNDRTAGGFKGSTQTVLSEQPIAPAEFIISGQQTIVIQIVN